MISKVELFSQPKFIEKKTNSAISPEIKNKVVHFKGLEPTVDSDKFATALRALNATKLASSISFGSGTSIFDALYKANTMVSCQDPDLSLDGESVGDRLDINKIVASLKEHYAGIDNSRLPTVKSNIEITTGKGANDFETFRTQLKKLEDGSFYYSARQFPKSGQGKVGAQSVSAILTEKTQEEVAFMETKGKLTPIIRDGENVLLIGDGQARNKERYGTLAVTRRDNKAIAEMVENSDADFLAKLMSIQLPLNKAEQNLRTTNGNPKEVAKETLSTTFVPFDDMDLNVPEVKPVEQKSIKTPGGVLIVGLQEGRFCKELIQSLKNFEQKIKSGEIVLPTFEPKEGAENMRILMLAGGFGSRAEYTNASSDAIFLSDYTKADITKGAFVMPTGLTPMETSLVTLHLSGILNCSKDYFEIGKNLKFYMNAANSENKGNGGFTLDMFDTMNGTSKTKDNQYQFILPNDSLSRMPIATQSVADIMSKGDTAVAMISKMVPKESARGNFGIMKIDSKNNNQILQFAEKPKDDKTLDEFAINDGMELVNTFQFAVSAKAIKALKTMTPSFIMPTSGNNKDALDWSSHFMPTLMLLSRCENKEQMVAALPQLVGKMLTPDASKYFIEPTSGTVFKIKPDGSGMEVLMQKGSKDCYTTKFEGNKYLVNKETGMVANLTEKTLSDPKYLNFLNGVSDKIFDKGKAELGEQKVVSVPSDELWFDVGQLPDMYNAITAIVKDNKNQYNMLPWERANAVACTNPATGLIASTPEQKAEIESKYDIMGRVYATQKATYVPPEIVVKSKECITPKGNCKSLTV